MENKEMVNSLAETTDDEIIDLHDRYVEMEEYLTNNAKILRDGMVLIDTVCSWSERICLNVDGSQSNKLNNDMINIINVVKTIVSDALWEYDCA